MMKLLTSILFLMALSQAAEVKELKKKIEEAKTEKRELEEGNLGIEKRTLISTVAPALNPGIEYADSQERMGYKLPSHPQIYATPLPQIAKISDVLTGQGAPFQAAIASHLYSPVSVYQTRLASPTTYQVSPPIPSQLAYSEHKIYQPSPSSVQYNPQIYSHRLEAVKSNFPPLTYQSHLPQQLLFNQPDVYQSQIYSNPRFSVEQNPQVYQERVQSYIQSLQNLPQIPASPPVVQPGITYAQEKFQVAPSPNSPVQADITTTEPTRVSEKEVAQTQSQGPQTFNNQPQDPISYASYSQSQPPSAPQPQYVQTSAVLPTPAYQAQYIQNFESFPVLNKQTNRPITYFRPELLPYNIPQYQNQYQHQQSGYNQYSSAPTFPQVQYFGKFAHAIFQGYQH